MEFLVTLINRVITRVSTCIKPFSYRAYRGVITPFIILVGAHLVRIFQHIPGTQPRPPTNSLMEECLWGFGEACGYAPGICWGSLRKHIFSG